MIVTKNIKIFFVLLVCVITSNILYCQIKDFNLWTNVGIDKKVNKKLSIEGEFQLRFNNNAQNLNGYYYSADFKYKLNKKWRVIIQSRYKTSSDEDVLRLGGGLNYDFKISKFKIDIRQLYQADIPMYKLSKDFYINTRHQLRSRLKIDTDLSSKLSASFAPEAYWRLDEGHIYLARMRYAFGLDYKIVKNTIMQLQYLVQPNCNPTGYLDDMDYIFGVGVVRKI